ncbi:MAG: PAS domain S-box protein, partial [Chloroflexi bacterium]|nr:PAS domain S-box protein [Chloroflexota bacterium]
MASHADLLERVVQLEESLESCRAALAQAQAQLKQEVDERSRMETELRRFRTDLDERSAELRASEQRYRSLFEGIPVGLYRTRPDGQILDVNTALVQMLGYTSQADLLALNATSLYIDPADRARWQELLQQEGIVRDFEVRFQRRDGAILWVRNSARVVKDEQGNVLHYEGSLEDITARKQAEADLRKYQEHLEEEVQARTAELRKTEERYRSLFDGVPVGLYRVTPAGQVLDVNLAAMEMMGYANRQEFVAVANAIDTHVDPEQRVRWQALMEQEGVARDFEEQLRRQDGSLIWVRDSARAVKDDQGQVLYYEGSMEDITHHKRLDEELRRQKDYFEAVLVNSPVAVVTADLDARIVSWNPAAERLFAYTPEEAIGQYIDDVVANHESLRAEAATYSHQATNVGRVQVTTRRTRKGGDLVDVELLALPLVLAGQRAGFIAIYHDITDRKQFEEQLRSQKEYFESLFVNSPAAVMTIDQDARIVSWNPMAQK